VASGATRDSITGRITGNLSKIALTIEAPTLAATFTERGTKPHGINPRKKGALRWATRGGSMMIWRDPTTQRWIARSAGRGGIKTWSMRAGRLFAVWHPGTAATHWFSYTVAAEAPWLRVEIKAAIHDALRV
jgi:hypothetical protein